MSDASDSQNMSGEDEPYVFGGDPSDVECSGSTTASEPMPLRASIPLPIQPPLRRVGETGGRTWTVLEEIGPVDRASASGEGNPLQLLVEEEEDEGGEGETDEGEEEGGNKENVITVARPGKEKLKNPSKRRKVPPVEDVIDVTVDGKVSTISSTMTDSKLDALRCKYNIDDDVVLMIPTEREVVCSDRDSEDKVCLFEHMFQWGLRIVLGERPPIFRYLAHILAHYHLSPDQLTANGFLSIMGFWAFMYERRGEDTPISEGPFAYFYELEKGHKEGRYPLRPEVSGASVSGG